jgi:septum formation protein
MLILASKSPRRKHLLELAEIKFEIITEDTPEDFDEAIPVHEVPLLIAQKKAEAIFTKHPNRSILAADTVVILHNNIIGKPVDRKDAIQILTKLSGNTHEVVTGVVITHEGKKHAFSDSTKVTFHELTIQQIEYYVDTYQPYDKAGAYAIQEWIGAIGIQQIDGCFYNVMGLPISLVCKKMKELAIL